MRRGVAAQHPSKYVLDENELQRVSGLARVEFEDARKELEKAHEIAQTMGRGLEDDDDDEHGENTEDDESAWIE